MDVVLAMISGNENNYVFNVKEIFWNAERGGKRTNNLIFKTVF